MTIDVSCVGFIASMVVTCYCHNTKSIIQTICGKYLTKVISTVFFPAHAGSYCLFETYMLSYLDIGRPANYHYPTRKLEQPTESIRITSEALPER